MSGDEKNAQIGAAVSEYQAAKVEVARVEQKVERVFKAYRDAGGTMDRNHGSTSEPTLENGKVKFGWSNDKIAATDILNVGDLAVLIEERDKARKRLKEAKQLMNSLGVTGLS